MVTVPIMFVSFFISLALITLLLWYGDFIEKNFTNVVIQNHPTILYLAVIVGFQELFYTRLCAWLTRSEMHRVYREHVRSEVSKTAFFQLVNYLGWFAYVAFWQMDIPYLKNQLVMFMTVKQVIALCQETVIPKLLMKRKMQAIKADDQKRGLDTKDMATDGYEIKTTLEKELEKQAQNLGEEYQQMAVLFAATTSFAVAFPLGPCLALIHCHISMRSDGWKFLKLARRAPPTQVDAIVADTWVEMFEAISTVGLITNVCCLAVADSSLYTPLRLFTLEHVLLAFKFYLAWSIPDTPEWLERNVAMLKEDEAETRLEAREERRRNQS
jgi:hypothetical protein